MENKLPLLVRPNIVVGGVTAGGSDFINQANQIAHTKQASAMNQSVPRSPLRSIDQNRNENIYSNNARHVLGRPPLETVSWAFFFFLSVLA